MESLKEEILPPGAIRATAGTTSIEGLFLFELGQITDSRGAVLHIMRRDSPAFREFGEVYCSEILPGVVKAWKMHMEMYQSLVVPVGRVELVVYDGRCESSTKGTLFDCELGRPDCYLLAVIPPGTWYGFRTIGDSPALIVNCTTMPHDPADMQVLPADTPEIPFVWGA